MVLGFSFQSLLCIMGASNAHYLPPSQGWMFAIVHYSVWTSCSDAFHGVISASSVPSFHCSLCYTTHRIPKIPAWCSWDFKGRQRYPRWRYGEGFVGLSFLVSVHSKLLGWEVDWYRRICIFSRHQSNIISPVKSSFLVERPPRVVISRCVYFYLDMHKSTEGLG